MGINYFREVYNLSEFDISNQKIHIAAQPIFVD